MPLYRFGMAALKLTKMFSNIKKGLWVFVFLLSVLSTTAQKDSFLSGLLPHHAKLQYAGSIGFLSFGVGYQIKKDKLHADIIYGYTPESVGGLDIHAVTAKATWFPVKDKIWKNDIHIRPLSTGVLVNYTFGKQYFGFNPDNYPYDYYKFPTAFHVGAFVGGQVNKKINNKTFIKRVGLYYELGTLDTEVISFIRSHKALALSDIINLGIGLVTTF
jgi:hypothetical protein